VKSPYLEWEHSPGAAAGRTLCPVCHAQFRYHLVAYTAKGEPVERFECHHDHDLHMRLGVPYVGRCRSPTERAALSQRLVRPEDPEQFDRAL
jgi:hypothetical protein